MSGPMLAAACDEYGRSGVVYVVHANGAYEAVTAEEYAAIPPEVLRGCSVCLTRTTMLAEVAIRRRVRS